MSKPDPTGESLESILASIRRSLSEQSTDVLAEEVPAAPADVPGGVISGLTRRLAESAEDAPSVDDAEPAEPEPKLELLGLPHQDPAPSAPPSAPAAPVASAPAPAQPQKDALWFLGGRDRPAAPESGPPAAAEPARPAAVDPKPVQARTARSGVLRGPLPPFFGSSAEAQKAEVVLVHPNSAGAGMILPPAPPKTANGQGGPGAGQVGDGLRNGAAGALFGHAAPDARAAPEGATPHVHALEAMVAELLRPMLQRWLDENMPRLVSAALKDEAVRMAARDPRKP
jgi:uncharacterized protein